MCQCGGNGIEVRAAVVAAKVAVCTQLYAAHSGHNHDGTDLWMARASMESRAEARGFELPDVAHRMLVPTDANGRAKSGAGTVLVPHLQRRLPLPRHGGHQHRGLSTGRHDVVRRGERVPPTQDVPRAATLAGVRKSIPSTSAPRRDRTVVDHERGRPQHVQRRRGDTLGTKRHRSRTKIRALSIFRKPTTLPIVHARAFATMRAIFPCGSATGTGFDTRAVVPPTLAKISRGATLRVSSPVDEVLLAALRVFIRDRFVSPIVQARDAARRTLPDKWASDDTRASLAVDAWARTGRVCAVRPAFKPTLHNLICEADVYRAMPLLVHHVPACARGRLYTFMLGSASK